MGLVIPHQSQQMDGSVVSMAIDSAILSLCQEIQNLDWRLYVDWNGATQRYEVWRHADNGQDFIIKSYPSNEFDSRVLQDLRAGDMWVNPNLMDEILKSQEDYNASQDAKLHELAEDLADRMGFISKKHTSGSDELTEKEVEWYYKEVEGRQLGEDS